jgi:hypothetical protein
LRGGGDVLLFDEGELVLNQDRVLLLQCAKTESRPTSAARAVSQSE